MTSAALWYHQTVHLAKGTCTHVHFQGRLKLFTRVKPALYFNENPQEHKVPRLPELFPQSPGRRDSAAGKPPLKDNFSDHRRENNTPHENQQRNQNRPLSTLHAPTCASTINLTAPSNQHNLPYRFSIISLADDITPISSRTTAIDKNPARPHLHSSSAHASTTSPTGKTTRSKGTPRQSTTSARPIVST